MLGAWLSSSSDELFSGSDPASPLWLDLVSVPVGGQYSSTIVDLRPDRSARPPPTELPPADQSIHVEDNRKVCRVLLYDGRFLKRWKIRAFLYVTLPGRKEPLELPALGVRVVDGRHVLLIFPSLHAKGLKPERVALRMEHGDDEPADYDTAVYSLQPR